MDVKNLRWKLIFPTILVTLSAFWADVTRFWLLGDLPVFWLYVTVICSFYIYITFISVSRAKLLASGTDEWWVDYRTVRASEHSISLCFGCVRSVLLCWHIQTMGARGRKKFHIDQGCTIIWRIGPQTNMGLLWRAAVGVSGLCRGSRQAASCQGVR